MKVDAGGKVLVVDDDPDVRESLQMVLEVRGFAVATAANGQEALELMRHQPPRLVLLDLMMPVMSGAELLDIVRHDSALARIRIIVVTAWPEEAAHICGTRTCVSKPIDFTKLLQMVAQH
jgi:CheY-like chemotaxis protein